MTDNQPANESSFKKDAAWQLYKAKTVLRMTDDDISEVIGVSRPLVMRMHKDIGTMKLHQLDLLTDHLKTQASLLKAERLS